MILCRSWFFGLSAALLASVLGGCHESSVRQSTVVANPAHSVQEASAVPVAASEATSAASVATIAASAGVGVIDAGAPAPPPHSELEGPSILDGDGNALPQTEQRPTVTSPSFEKRMAMVAQAILSGEVEPASVAFFPLVAYQQVKDVAKPERDYKFRLLANFKRDLLEYHRALGDAAATAKFEGVTVSEKDVKWMRPGSEGNKVGYFRVLRSRLRFVLPMGRTRDLELTSLISWRGEWYVVHLHGFK